MDDAEGFSETARCMESIGIGSEAKEGVFRVSSWLMLLWCGWNIVWCVCIPFFFLSLTLLTMWDGWNSCGAVVFFFFSLLLLLLLLLCSSALFAGVLVLVLLLPKV